MFVPWFSPLQGVVVHSRPISSWKDWLALAIVASSFVHARNFGHKAEQTSSRAAGRGKTAQSEVDSRHRKQAVGSSLAALAEVPRHSAVGVDSKAQLDEAKGPFRLESPGIPRNAAPCVDGYARKRLIFCQSWQVSSPCSAEPIPRIRALGQDELSL